MVRGRYIKVLFKIAFALRLFESFAHPAICGHQVPNRFIIDRKGHKLEKCGPGHKGDVVFVPFNTKHHFSKTVLI